jgi:antitoxin HicB
MEHYLARFDADPEDGGFVVRFPDFGYGVTQGESETEALELARDLLVLTIGDFMRAGRPLPQPKRHAGRNFHVVALTALQCAKVDLYTAFLTSGLKKAELARRIGCFHCAIARGWTRLRRRSPRWANGCMSRRAMQREGRAPESAIS